MRFRFKLERLKRVRAIEERAARAAWAEGERAAARAEEALEALRTEVRQARTALEQGRGRALDPSRAELGRGAVDGMLRALVGRREAALSTRGQASRLGEAWRARKADHRALEELETRHRERFRRDRERAETQAMDEVALTRQGRRESDSSLEPDRADETEP